MKEETGLRLKNIRKLLNIKQKELAASLGLTAASISTHKEYINKDIEQTLEKKQKVISNVPGR